MRTRGSILVILYHYIFLTRWQIYKRTAPHRPENDLRVEQLAARPLALPLLGACSQTKDFSKTIYIYIYIYVCLRAISLAWPLRGLFGFEHRMFLFYHTRVTTTPPTRNTHFLKNTTDELHQMHRKLILNVIYKSKFTI